MVGYETIDSIEGLHVWGSYTKVNPNTVSSYRKKLMDGEDIGPIPVVSWGDKLILTRYNRNIPSEQEIHERLAAYILEDYEIPIIKEDESRVHLRANRQLSEIIDESFN